MPARDVTATINPADYVSEFDALPSSDPTYRAAQYTSARELASHADATVYISRTGSWSATYTDPQYGTVRVWAYETLGKHRDTDELIRGWLDGGARIMDYRPV